MGLVESLRTLKVFADAGLVRPALPSQLIGMGLAFARWGITPAGGWAVGSARYPNQPALVDELGTLTFAEVDEMSSAIAAGLVDRGIRAGSNVGILARNSRWVGLSLSALGKAGADAVLLNTGFAAPQLADVVTREQIRAVIADAEFAPAVAGLPASVRRIVAWQDATSGQALRADAGGQALPGTEASWTASLADLARGGGTRLSRPDRPGRQVLLTSGTTGTPKGAEREVGGPEPGAALLSAIPLRARQTTYIASPVFHAWGLSHLGIGLLLSSTIVLRRRFDPEETLRLVEQHGVQALVVVPVMLARLLDLPEPVRRHYDLSTLRVVAVSGAALPAELALRFMDAFGDIVYNLYGATEVAYASVAGPADLRAAPGTAGRALPGAVVRIVDAQGRELPRNEVGRIFVGNSMPFSGYTSGEDKERLGSLVSTGDLGYLDPKGRLFVVGRSDDMIVSGGENVFPAEVEDLLAAHPGVVEAAVVGVPDEQMGQRLLAFVVPRDPALSEADLRAYVRTQLANYKVPREVRFLDALPRNAAGKVVKRELVAR
ncbi:MAG: AMP-binding protein, partial [Frankiaceae bacterium]